MSLKENLAAFLAETKISERVKLEVYLLVALGVRKAGLIMVPSEIPGLEGLGPEIDNEFYWRTTGRRDPGASYVEYASTKLRDAIKRFGKKSLPYRMELLREIFNRRIIETTEFQAHVSWAHQLGLRYRQEEVRPTIREVWIYRDADAGREIERLGALRKHLRFEALRNPKAGMPMHYRVFPEESSPEFVRGVGDLLGYPPSCLNKYVADRSSPEANVEMRAAQQMIEARAAGKPVLPEAYFVKDFFPCTPDCPEACEVGTKALEQLTELDPALGERYAKVLQENMNIVHDYPEIIQAHAEDLNKRAQAYQEEARKLTEK